MLDLAGVHWLAVLAALVAHMVLGAIWFHVYSKPWSALAHPGKTQEQIRAGPKWVYGVAALGGLVTAIVLSAVLDATASGIADALGVAFFLWLAFVLAKYATTYAFEYRSWTLLAIDVGYPLVSLLAQAAILSAWP